ncbi:MAG: PIN domain-containing protein, partial [Actinomycetes bacterium]
DGYLVDTSAIMDGRFAGLVRAGVLTGDLLVPRFVLDELQGFADGGPESPQARRARRGLESLDAFGREGAVRVRVLDDEVPEVAEVDAKLVALARRLELRLITADATLARVAEIQGVPTLNVRRLAADLAAPVVAGETLTVRILKPGREPGQGVGFLDDGSMVVVNGGADAVGAEPIEVTVSSVVPNAAGRIVFARPVVAGAPVGTGPTGSGIMAG